MVPLTYPNDREAIVAALMTLRPYTQEDVRIVHIKNTLELMSMLASQGCLADLESKPDLEIGTGNLQLEFDRSGNLITPLN
jgi:hypothetical protein